MDHSSSGSHSKLDLAKLSPVFDRILDGTLDFKLNYQPIVDLRRGTAVGYECLVRFPEEIGLPPDVCFRAAGLCGKRLALEELVARRSLETVAVLPANCFLSVNVSPALIMSDSWERLVAVAPDFTRVLFEITEQDPVDDYLLLRDRIQAVLARGGHIAVDDAGAGYASLKHAMELRPNFLKLDRYFVGECHESYAKSTLVEMIGKAASRMDAWVVAEGIEKLEELDELIRIAVPLGQGYFLGKPMAEMLPLPEEKSLQIIARTRALLENETLHSVTESCTSTPDRSEAEAWPRKGVLASLVAVVDTWNRPTDLFEMHPELGWRAIPQPLRVAQSTSVEEALHRSLTRPQAHRFDTMMVVNERGALKGVVRIEKLIQAMLQDKGSASRVIQMPSASNASMAGPNA